MKRYKFQFSTLMLVLLVIAFACCLAGAGLSLFNILSANQTTRERIFITMIILIIVSLTFGGFLLSILLYSRYTFGNMAVIFRLGFLRSQYLYEEISSIHLFQGMGKLAIYFQNGKHASILIKRENFDSFVKELLSKNDGISFSFSTSEEEEEFKNMK